MIGPCPPGDTSDVDAAAAKPALVFRFPQSPGCPAKISAVAPIPGTDTFEITPEIARRLAHAGPVNVFNRTGSASVYFVPYSAETIRRIKPATDFATALHVADGCSLVDFDGLETLSAIHGETARLADKFSKLDARRSELTPEEDVELGRELKELKTVLNGPGGVDRAPTTLAAPTFADPTTSNETGSKPVSPVTTGNAPAKKNSAAKDGKIAN